MTASDTRAAPAAPAPASAARTSAAPAPEAPTPGRPGRPSLGLVAALSAAVVAFAVGGYAVTGSPQLVRDGVPAAAVANAQAASAARAAGMAQIASMVDGLAERLKARPDDAEGWFMLARSYTVLGRFADSLPVYARAAELDPGNAALVADWADATAAARSSVTHPDAVALVQRALAIDPQQPKALAIAGTMDFERGDYAGAIRHWQRLADRLPPGSELRQQVEGGIADARTRAGGAATGVASAGSAGSAGSAVAGNQPSSPTGAQAAAIAGKTLSGSVSVAPELAASIGPGDTLFVFARSATGPRMPLAVRRVPATEIANGPWSFSLDDTMAMTPQMTISKADRVVIGARISKSGNATPQPGDLQGESEPVAPGATGVAVKIDRVVR